MLKNMIIMFYTIQSMQLDGCLLSLKQKGAKPNTTTFTV